MLVPEGPLADERGQPPSVGVYGARRPSLRFTGRGRELWRIHRLLHPARVGGALRGVAVRTHGLGGIGKTELAAAYVEDFAAAYPGGVYWLNLATYAPAAEPNVETAESAWLDALARTLARHSWLAGDPPALRLADAEGKALPSAVVRARLANLLGEEPSLWVLDNAPPLRPDDLRARILDAWAAPGAHGRTLVTSRDSRPMAGYGEIPLDVLGEEDALRLLARFRKPANPGEAEAAHKLAAEVGRHTLALNLLGHRVHGAVHGYREVLAHLHARGRLPRIEEIAERLRPTLGESARGLLATFEGSIDPLSEPARRLLGLTAACAPNTPIPSALLAAAYSKLEGAPEDETDRADQVDLGLSELVEGCLLTRRDGSDGLLEIHPLLAEAVPELLGHTMDAPVPVLAAALLERIEDAADIRRHGEMAADILHARHLASMREDEEAVKLALLVGQFERVRGNYRAVMEIETLARSLAESVLGTEHELTLVALNNLAATLEALGDAAGARELHERALAVSSRVLGEEHPDTRLSAWNLFMTLLGLDDTEAVRRVFEAHLAGLLDRDPATLAAQDRTIRERLIPALERLAAPPPAAPELSDPPRGWLGRLKRWLGGRFPL